MQMAILSKNRTVKERSFTTFQGKTRPANMIEVYHPLNVINTVNCRFLGKDKIGIDDKEIDVTYLLPMGKHGYARCIGNGTGDYDQLLVAFEYYYDTRESFYNLYIPVKTTDKNMVVIYPPSKRTYLIDISTAEMKHYSGSLVIFVDDYIIVNERIYTCEGTTLVKVPTIDLLKDTDRFIVNDDGTVTMMGDKQYKFKIKEKDLLLI